VGASSSPTGSRRRYSSFLIRRWELTAGRERIDVCHLQTGHEVTLTDLDQVARWIEAPGDHGRQPVPVEEAGDTATVKPNAEQEDRDMGKVIFVLHRRTDLTRQQCLDYWSSERHTSILRELPGLTKWAQNHVVSAPGEPVCDGIGELWFESDEAMEKALNSPQMAAAVEDAQNFLDMERTGLIIVEEKTIIG
jgi:uncharacterized protein (TIGR02118 family)